MDDTGRRTVLIIEDNDINREMLSLILENDYNVLQAENGREALLKYREEDLRILILDIEMPGVTGLQAAEEIRKEDKDTVIIFLTAFDEFNYAKKAVSVHALDYLLNI